MNQRWLNGRATYRPAEPINTRLYDVTAISADAPVKAFICDHHYSRSYPAARFRFGLYRGPDLVGVAVFSHPCNDAVLTNVFRVPAIEAVELGRFVLLDSVPGNGETWFIARCFELLRGAGLVGVLAHSDPVARSSINGDMVFKGHFGTIYQAHNARYLGRSSKRMLRLMPDGSVLSPRSIQKLRGRERGWEYVLESLRAIGAPAPPATGDWTDWVRATVNRCTRPLSHPVISVTLGDCLSRCAALCRLRCRILKLTPNTFQDFCNTKKLRLRAIGLFGFLESIAEDPHAVL